MSLEGVEPTPYIQKILTSALHGLQRHHTRIITIVPHAQKVKGKVCLAPALLIPFLIPLPKANLSFFQTPLGIAMLKNGSAITSSLVLN